MFSEADAVSQMEEPTVESFNLFPQLVRHHVQLGQSPFAFGLLSRSWDPFVTCPA